tara:strand:+ start:2073 stop:3164 length:1092 start_codon:yes stop_codon:yes gene_type:complete
MAITEKYLDTSLGLGADAGTEAAPWMSWSSAAAGLATGERLNVKAPASRIVLASNNNLSFGAVGSGQSPIHIRGYSSSIGDGGIAEYGGLSLTFGDNVLVEGIDIANSANTTTACFDSTGYNTTFYRCKGSKSGANADDIRIFDCTKGGNVVNCYAKLSGENNATGSLEGVIDITNGVAYGNIIRITDFVGKGSRMGGIKLTSSSEHASAAVRNLIYTDRGVKPSFALAGIVCEGMTRTDQGGYHIVNNTIDNFVNGIQMFGIGTTATPGTPVLVNNLITSCPTACYGMTSSDAPPQILFVNNAIDGVVAGVVPIDIQRITKEPYTDADNRDYSPNAKRGGGAVCRARAADVNGTLDIGAIAV